VYSTFLPSNAAYYGATGVAVDSGGNAIVAADSYVTKINAAGSAWLYNVYLPVYAAPGSPALTAVAVDAQGNAHVAGGTSCPYSGPVLSVNPLMNSTCVNTDPGQAFVASIDPTGVLYFGTLLGGAAGDGATSIAVDPAGALYLAGATRSADFPLVGGIPHPPSLWDVFVTKIVFYQPPVRPVSTTPSAGSGSTQTFVFQFADDAGPGDLAAASVQFAPALATTDYSGTCTFHYLGPTNRLELSAGIGVWTGAAPGAATTLQNGMCSLDAAGSTAQWNGTGRSGSRKILASSRQNSPASPAGFHPPVSPRVIWS